MVLKDYYIKDVREKRFTSVDVLTLVYIALTSIILAIYGPSMDHFPKLVLTRIIAVFIIGTLYGLAQLYPSRLTTMFRVVVVMLGLVLWYQELYYFCSQLPYKDHIFATADWKLFGCQPSIEFSKHVTSVFWSEAFNLGYYSYYYIMFVVIIFYAIFRYDKADKAQFIFLASFFLYYIIYIFLPAAGPYYYFEAIGLDMAASGNYPDLGYYFQTHHDMLPSEETGIFSQLVHDTQELGELPAAAFPSSHCGMTVVIMLLTWKSRNRWLFWLLMPLAILLCLATVYIKAHYLVDSIAGILSAFIFYYITSFLYDALRSHI